MQKQNNIAPSDRWCGIRKKLTVVAVGLGIALVSGCDSGGLPTAESERVSGTSPNVPGILDISGLMARTVRTSPADLLINGGFEQGLDGWQSCSSSPPSQLVNDSSDGGSAVLVKRRNCVQQGVAITPGASLVLSCDAKMKSNRNDWTGVGLSFYDEFWNFISEPAASVVSGDSFNTYAVSGDAPPNARNVAVWFYTENQAIVDNCILQNGSEPPQPPFNENLLVNGEFVQGDGTAVGWSDRCSGTYQRVSNIFGETLFVADGACVHHRPDSDVLQALQGNHFAYSCEYTKSGDSYASIAANLTTRRDETGQNDVAVLPKTYFGGVPTFQVETVTLYGKAKDYLAPGDTFVSIGDQGSGLVVLGCSLEIVSGQAYSIGDVGPAGGTIFQLTDDGMHGLEAAPTDVQGGLWCADNADIEGMDNFPVGSGPDNRPGSYNTDRINYRCAAGTVAAQTSSYLWPNGQQDGFLPNKDELFQLYQQRNAVGGFSSEAGLYASSTEVENSTGVSMYAVAFFVDNAVLLTERKDAFVRARAIRSF